MRGDGIVTVIGQKVQARIAEASCMGEKSRSAQAQFGVVVADFLACADFREAAEGVSDVHANVCSEDPVIGERVAFAKDFERVVGGIATRREKPFRRGIKRPVQLALDAVGIAKLQVGSPFGAVPSNVHERQACQLREGDVVAFRAVYGQAEIQKRRRVGSFV